MPSHAVPPQSSSRSRVGFAALSYQIQPGATEIQLTPAGEFRSWDGRPTDAPRWYIDDAIAAQVIALAAARANPLVIDYEHQTLNAQANGKPAPAAGFFKDMEWRPGVGLFAMNVEWTAPAAAHIDAGEYRYVSPVFEYDKMTGAVQRMRMAALVNDPGVDGMASIAALSALLNPPVNDQESTDMDLLTSLLAALGLAAGTTQETALTAVAALKAKADQADTQIAALKAAAPGAGTPDPAKYVPIEVMQGLQTEIVALKAASAAGGADALIEGALKDGRLLPVQKQWAQELGRTNLAALKAYVDTAQPMAALQGLQSQAAGGGQKAAPGQLGESELAVCKAMNLTAEQYMAAKGV